MQPYFPLFVNLVHKKVRVYGAGKIAVRRISGLLRFGACVTVVAPCVLKELWELCTIYPGQLVVEQRLYQSGEIRKKETDFVLAATNDILVNQSICAECRRKAIFVNNASDRNQCDFYFPALVEQDGFVIGVTGTDGDHKKVAEFCAGLRENSRIRADRQEDDNEKTDSDRDTGESAGMCAGRAVRTIHQEPSSGV